MERSKEFYQTEYVDKQRSPQDIAQQFNTYPNKIRREILKYGFKLRNKSEAQSVALQTGRHKHPTKGSKRPDLVKIQISEKMAENWSLMDDTERNRRIEIGKKQWEMMDPEDKIALQQAALDAVRETSKDGSKLEKFLLNELHKLGYKVLFHSEHILPNTRLQTDLYIPSHKTVIEIDGPSHFYPIWGQDNLEKNISADNKKNSSLLTYGFVIIRIKHLIKTISEIHKRKLLEEVSKKLKEISLDFPELSKRLIEIEL